MRKWIFFCLLLVLLLLLQPNAVHPEAEGTVSISGTVTGPGGVVGGVFIGVGSDQDWQETTTAADGTYALSIETEGVIRFHVRPDVATGLAQINQRLDGVGSSVVQDFLLGNGNTLTLTVTAAGTSLTHPLPLDTLSLVDSPPEGQWYTLDWQPDVQQYQATLPPDIYYVSAYNPPSGYYDTTLPFDLRGTGQTAVLPLHTEWVHSIPTTPPDATKISVGPVDGLGEATVTGAAGAALPLAQVLLVNLNSTHQADAVSNADGSFTAQIFAPPGSALMIKHGPASERWSALETGVAEGINPFPGTILHVPGAPTRQQDGFSFATTGSVLSSVDDQATTLNYVGAAWTLTGTLAAVSVDGQWTRVFTGTYDGGTVPGLYRGGLNWTHPALADLDDDADLDLVIGSEYGSLTYYENEGTATTPDWVWQTAVFAGVHTNGWAYPTLVDVNGDGAPDLFVGNSDSSVLVYYNDGTPAAPAWPAQPDATLPAGNSPSPTLTDLDGDGDLDLLAGNASGTLYHYQNTGTPAAPVWTYQSDTYAGIAEGDWVQPAFIDLDGDTDLDMLLGQCGWLIWYERGGTAVAPTWTQHIADPVGYGGGSCGTSPAAADWDGNGAPDLVFGDHWGLLRFFAATGTSTWSEQTFEFPFEFLGDSAPALGDWDNDGDPDLLVGQAHGEVLQYTNVGTAVSPDWRPDGLLLTLPWTNHPHPFPTLADVDDDNDLDLFIGEGDWNGPSGGGNLRYYRNDGTPTVPNWQLQTDTFLGLDVGGWSAPTFADIDDDNDLDLFIGDAAGTLTFVENTGTAVSPAWAAPVQPYANLDLGEYSAPAFHDADADGDLDLLVGLEHGSLAYVRNVGTPAAPVWELVATQTPGIDLGANARPAVADLTGDGTADLLVGEGEGGLNLYRYDGPTTPPPAGNFAPGDLFQVSGRMHLVGPAIDAGTNPGAVAAQGWLSLMMIGAENGRFLPAQNYFMSSQLTPTGFPIQHPHRAALDLQTGVTVDNWQYVGGHALAADVTFTAAIPPDAPAGTYRPLLGLNFTGVPTDTTWLAAYVTQFTFSGNEALLPPITVGQPDAPRLPWRLLMEDFAQGMRGTGAREDEGEFALASQIVSQGAPYITPLRDARTGQMRRYRLEPFLPAISFTDRRMPAAPLLPFDLPGGTQCVSLQDPAGRVQDLGCAPFQQSLNRSSTTRGGHDLNNGTVQLEDVYSLTTGGDQFEVTFAGYGRHVITMTGTVPDVWGNIYAGGGTYEVWVAELLDIDPGVLPGTPLAVGDAFNPTFQFYPRVPADVSLTLTHYPNSDPAAKEVFTLTGRANQYGTFSAAGLQSPIVLSTPGEFRVDVTAVYTAAAGTLYAGSMTWGSVVMTPEAQADLVAHGRRGLDSLASIPTHWFVNCRDLPIAPDAISHLLNPYFNGDVIWSRLADAPGECPTGVTSGGDSLILGASVQDTVGVIETAVLARARRMNPELSLPGDLTERFTRGEIPLFSSTYSGLSTRIAPADVDQVAYSYRSSQRPGVRVRELVAEDGQSGGYWRLNTLYDNQYGVGIQGDQPNDFKFQYLGVVYRDLDSGHSEYLGHGSGWIFIPDDDATGSRVMPPFAGPGNGGWTTEGGPLLTLLGDEIHIFIYPTGTRPGAVLETGDLFRFAGHVMPTLDSKVAFTVTAPGGTQYSGSGQANSIGYFYDPAADFVVDEPGVWTVDVQVWHDGQCSGGATVPPYPTGDVLGSENGRYTFYVVPPASAPLAVDTPSSGFLDVSGGVSPITISGTVPAAITNASVELTISMPGTILQQETVVVVNGRYAFTLDPAALQQDFPNLDLVGREGWRDNAGLADTLAVGLLLSGTQQGQPVYRANTITLQGERVYVGSDLGETALYLPVVRQP